MGRSALRSIRLDADSEDAKLLPKYFMPTCRGGQLQFFEMNTMVDLVGKLVEAEEPRAVLSRGQSTMVCNALLIGPDRVGVSVGFWDDKAQIAKQLNGQVVVAYGCSVVRNGDEKQVNRLPGAGQGRDGRRVQGHDTRECRRHGDSGMAEITETNKC